MNLFTETPAMRARRTAAGECESVASVWSAETQNRAQESVPSGSTNCDASKRVSSSEARKETRREARIEARHEARNNARDKARDGGRSEGWREDRPESRNEVRADESYSLEQESYQAELAYDKQRARRHKLLVVVRTLAAIVLVPAALLIIFLVSYVLTCIVSGATPEEVVELLRDLVQNAIGFVQAFL